MRRTVFLIISFIALVTSYVCLILMIYSNLFASIQWMVIGSVIFTSLLFFSISIYTYGLNYREQIKNLQNRLARWSKLSPRVNQIGDDAFHELPIGIIVLDDTLKEIKWVNQYAKVIFDNKLVDKALMDISEPL